MTDNAPNRSEARTAAAAYIADLTADLAMIAKRHRLNTLGYLLDMATLEAENIKGMDGSAS